ncbi:MAG: hypothetical protein J4F48_13065 [Nitrospinae bacterium]|nr:hypothetical protein [Nitrospinota bacterium]
MESGARAKMMTAVSTALAWFGLDSLSGYITMSRGGVFVGSGVTKNMQIIIFSVKSDKFTGFFDKYLKSHGKEVEAATDYISVGYENGLSRKINSFSNFIE